MDILAMIIAGYSTAYILAKSIKRQHENELLELADKSMENDGYVWKDVA